ncbi:kinesin-like protein KIF20B isoform 1-T1 [Synchiropus picturatus]
MLLKDSLHGIDGDCTEIEMNSTTNRSLETGVQERQHLQVYLRIRPFTSAEIESGESQDYFAIEPPDTILVKPPGLSLLTRHSTDRPQPHVGQRFQFSQVYGPETTQRQLFQGTVQDLVKDVLDGGHSLLFTYGVTNTGKTYTFLGPDADAGILPRSLQVIFSSIEDRVFNGMSIKPHRCREFTSLTQEQQAMEATFKSNLLRQMKENDKCNPSILNSPCSASLEEDKIHLPLDTNTKFSVWVSFCEIYNENIHDLLEVAPSAAARRPMLRLSEDHKGNAFVKDLRWVQVDNAEEAYKLMKLGKKNQSFSSTKLNQLSSRSHSIFSIRIMKIEDAGGVQAVGELCLCDLAGSERCAKTQNNGIRLKEAGNINTSLLILGKCINILRQNQQTKLFQHVPFRESKLTRYLQSFFCTRGKACMIVNINQCASMYDETLNVLKFSAIAQQVIVLSAPVLPSTTQTSADDSSVNHDDTIASCNSMRSSLSGLDTSLMDLWLLGKETTGETTDEEDDNKILVSKRRYQLQEALINELQMKLKKERADYMIMETSVREEICSKFTSLYSEMQSNFESRLAREIEIVEQRADERLDIFKKLIDKMVTSTEGQPGQSMENSVEKYSSGLAELKKAIETAEVGMALDKVDGQGDKLSGDLVAHSFQGELFTPDKENLNLRLQLQEMTLYVDQLQRQVSDLQRAAEPPPLHIQEAKTGEKQMLQVTTEIQCAEHSLVPDQAAHIQINESIMKTANESRLMEEVPNFTSSLVQQNQIQEVTPAKELLLHQQVTLDQEGQEFIEHQVSRQESSLHMKKTLCEQSYEQQLQEQLKVKLQDEELNAQMQLDQMKLKLNEQEETFQTLVKDLKLKCLKEEEISECLRIKLGEVTSSHEELRKINSELQAEILSLAQIKEGNNASVKESKENRDENISAIEKPAKSSDKISEVAEQEEGEVDSATQEAQHQEVNKYRELLEVARKTIIEKDVELLDKTEEISRLKENNRQHCERLLSLDLDLQRNNLETSDLLEKLADYKKQIQQVQKEIASMRDQERVMKLNLSEADKVKKHLQAQLGIWAQTVKQQKVEIMSSSMSDQLQKQYQKACDDLKDKERVLEDMRSTLIEQEETQEQMDQMLAVKENVIQELSNELERVRGTFLRRGGTMDDGISDALRVAKEELNQAQESMKLSCEKQQLEKKRWQEDKLSLISQVQEAEKKRNLEMRKFSEDRERYKLQNGHLESELAKMEKLMENWKSERDALVAALEIQLGNLLSSHKEKDQLIQELQQRKPCSPPKVTEVVDPVVPCEMVQPVKTSPSRKDSQQSVRSQGSTSYPSVLDSSEISTENGKTSRFPQPEMEISFSPLQPNRVALRRQGQENAITVKITNQARKRKSGEMEKSHIFRRSKRQATNKVEVEAENRMNTRTKLKPKLTVQQEEVPCVTGQPHSQATIKDGTLQKIGDFLQSSPTLLGSKAKKMLSLVSSRGDLDSLASSCSSSSLHLRQSKKKKMFRLEISSPMDMPSHPLLTMKPEEKESDFSLKTRLRSRIPK